MSSFAYETSLNDNIIDFIHNCPYRDPKKIKSLIKQKYGITITEKFIQKYIPKLNNFDKKEAKKKYQYIIIEYPHTYIGDIFFPVGNKVAFLLLVEANTRRAYAYQLGDITEKEIINVDNDTYERQIFAPKTGLKTTTSLIKAFNKFLNDNTDVPHPPEREYSIKYLKFDGESGINNDKFQEFLAKNNIKFIPVPKENINSLSVINRLCRTLRDIAFNMNVQIIDQHIMDKILDIYNNAPHKTLTKCCFNYDPSLKEIYPDGITPNDVHYSGTFGICPEGVRYLERVLIVDWKCKNYVRQEEIGELCLRDKCRIYEPGDKFEKKRSKLSKDIYQIVGKENGLYQCQNIKTGEIKNVQRAFVQTL